MSTNTIVSQSTPYGFSAIAIIRLSGKQALSIASKLSNNKVSLKHQKQTKRAVIVNNKKIDVGLYTAFLSPRSYTGEDVVEISCHGNIHVCEAIIKECQALGARLAEPGEYTKRAFLNGKINLLQAEAVAQLISAKSIEAVEQQTKNISGGITKKIKNVKDLLLSCLAHIEYELDVSEEPTIPKKTKDGIKNDLLFSLKEIELLKTSFKTGSVFSSGIKIVFIGKPNVGKSTLANKILGVEKSITNKTPGTTRDLVFTETTIEGVPTTFVDTAGIHDTKNEIEAEGIKRSLTEIKASDIIVSLFCHNLEVVDIKELKQEIFVYNKEDVKPYSGTNKNVFSVSAINNTGVKHLMKHIKKRVGLLKKNSAEPLITTIRQKDSIDKIHTTVSVACNLFNENNQETELVAHELRRSISHIDLFTGKTTTNDILDRVFSNFCVGK